MSHSEGALARGLRASPLLPLPPSERMYPSSPSIEQGVHSLTTGGTNCTKEDRAEPLLGAERQDARPVLGDRDGVLPMRGPAAVGGDDGPLVLEDLGVVGAEGEHRLDREH